jgi:2-iminobutanoate/2-iminopropanoate deaminase
MKKPIFSQKAPAPVGPYSQAVQVGSFVFASGHLGIDPADGSMPPDVVLQTRRAMDNLLAVLAEAGVSPEDIVKTTVFLADMDDFAIVNGIYETYFLGDFPARSCVQVSRLPKDAKVEVEAVAVLA